MVDSNATAPQPPYDWFLREWMATKNMNQAEIIRRTGWSKARMNEIYHGKTGYYREIVNAAAQALGIEPWQLLLPPDDAEKMGTIMNVLRK